MFPPILEELGRLFKATNSHNPPGMQVERRLGGGSKIKLGQSWEVDGHFHPEFSESFFHEKNVLAYHWFRCCISIPIGVSWSFGK